VQVIVIVVVWI